MAKPCAFEPVARQLTGDLEIGIHALEAVGLGEHGRGKEGGLSEYARQIGKGRTYVTQVRNAEGRPE